MGTARKSIRSSCSGGADGGGACTIGSTADECTPLHGSLAAAAVFQSSLKPPIASWLHKENQATAMSAGPIAISSDDEPFQIDDFQSRAAASDSQSEEGSCRASSAVATHLGNKRSSAPPPPGGIKKKPKRKSL
jgi:hypothetical protein